MTRRYFSKAAFPQPVFDEPPELTKSRRAHLLYAASPAVSTLPIEAFDLVEETRRLFFRARMRGRGAISHRALHRRFVRCRDNLSALLGEIGNEGPMAAAIRRELAVRAGMDLSEIFAALLLLDRLERAAVEAVPHHREPIVDQSTPFFGFVCELAWLWRGVLKADLVISNRPPISAFTRFAFAVMSTLPPEVHMHVERLDPGDEDSWGAFTKALQRADAATREFQIEYPIGRSCAWSLGGLRKRPGHYENS